MDLVAQLQARIDGRFREALPGLFAQIVAKADNRHDDEIMRLVLVYQVMIAKYVRTKILLKRRQSNYDRWSGVFIRTKPDPTKMVKLHDWGRRIGMVQVYDNGNMAEPFKLDNIGPRGQTETAYEALYLAMSAAQDDKNRIQEQLKALGISDATLRLIRQGKWV